MTRRENDRAGAADVAAPAPADVTALGGMLRAMLDLQTQIHATLRAKLDAMRRADVSDMQIAAGRTVELTGEFERIELQRLAIVGRLAAAMQMNGGKSFRMSQLLARLPEPTRSDLSALTAALRKRMLAVGDANRTVGLVGREMTEHMRAIVAAMAEAATPKAGYDRAGHSARAEACVLDAVG